MSSDYNNNINLKEDDIILDYKEPLIKGLNEEDDINNFLTNEEGAKIKDDMQLLQEIGYDKKLINKVYVLLRPPNIERAIDYMTEVDGIYQHDFFESHNNKKDKNLCFICQKPRKFHLDYIPDELLYENNNINNNINDNINDNDIIDLNDGYFIDFLNDNEEGKNDKNAKNNIILNPICNVCFDDLEEEEIKMNSLPCGHVCCTQCWLNYFKTLITEAKVESIKCVEHNCKQIISEEFIFKFIKDDKKLMSKYERFKERAKIIRDPNKKPCPKPDCESYLEKNPNKKYVKCKKGHEYCFDCLLPPHGKSTCEQILEKDFMKWKKNRLLKKCPRCQIFTEKNEGCNHMTCSSCKYQWCWLCLGEYKYGHYDRGDCKGHQFTKADNIQEAKKGRRAKYHFYREQNQHICCFTLFTIMPWFFHGFDEPFRFYAMWERYLAIFVFWFFGFFLFAGVSMANHANDRMNLGRVEAPFYIIGFLITFCLFVSFQIFFTCIITPFILVAIVYPYFIDNIFIFLDINA